MRAVTRVLFTLAIFCGAACMQAEASSACKLLARVSSATPLMSVPTGAIHVCGDDSQLDVSRAGFPRMSLQLEGQELKSFRTVLGFARREFRAAVLAPAAHCHHPVTVELEGASVSVCERTEPFVVALRLSELIRHLGRRDRS